MDKSITKILPVRVVLHKNDNAEYRKTDFGNGFDFWTGLVTDGFDIQTQTYFAGSSEIPVCDLFQFAGGTYAMLLRDGAGQYIDTSKFYFLKEQNGRCVPSAQLDSSCYFSVIQNGVKLDKLQDNTKAKITFEKSGNSLALRVGKYRYVDERSEKKKPYVLPDIVCTTKENDTYNIWRFQVL